MPRSFSKKDERQYEHVKDSYESRGKSEKTAEEIAARTVNKERKSEGRTKEQHSHGRSSHSRKSH
jgi:hypothetical protein